MSIFCIKIIACISMLLDHIKYAIPDTTNFLTKYGGRISFPLFAFMIVEGYTHTKNLKKYYGRLIIFAIISQIPFMLFRSLVGPYMMLNIMFTLLLGLMAITIYDKIPNKFLSAILCTIVIFLGDILNVDYGWYGVTVVFLLYICNKNKIMQTSCFLLLVLIYYYSIGYFKLPFNTILLYYLFTILPVIFIWLYNGKIGRKMKYFFYCFYPAHMLILYFMNFLLI